MAEQAFPSANDFNSFGRLMSETNLANLIAALCDGPFVVSGFAIPASAASLTIAVPAGVAVIDGRRIEVTTSTNVTVGTSNTHYLFLTYSVDGFGNLDGISFTTNTTDVAPARSVRIATLVAGASTITSTIDRRRVGNTAMQPMTPQAPTYNAGVSTGTAATTTLLNVTESGQLISIGVIELVVAGSGNANLVITVDGGTPGVIPLLVSGAIDASLSTFALDTPSPIPATILIPFGTYYRTSLKVELQVTSTGSGNIITTIHRAKAN